MQTDKPITARLKMALKEHESIKTAAELSRTSKVTEATVSNWLGNKIQEDQGKGLIGVKLSHALGIRAEWLFTGSGPMRSGIAPAQVVAPPETRPDYVRVEQMDAEGIMGKEGRVNDEVPEVIRAVDYTPSYIRSVMGFVPPPGRLVLITGRGNSMMPLIQPGDSILVDMGIKEFDGDGLYLINSGNGEQVKALQDRGGTIYVVSANSELFPAYPASKETRVLGKVYLRNRVDRFN